ncbi:hypothetical protein FHP25_29565 [Vineibacter terrae]|uniref:Uncharacterized protein n=1 Tax=Vineibacter terrae TaxID=2586908 RepID=A0A5C8PCQ7_9HYPH|nr:hypothetical protein [Vineibacter terrae]TXL71529.1 hypothetical protein FHP25_29565 [Vineibacter terrae]
MPSRGWYVVSVMVLVAAIAGAIWLTMARVGDMGVALVQVVVPGSATLDLKQPGTYTVYHERTSTVEGRVYTSPSISGLRVSVRAADGREIAVKRPGGTSNYDFNGRSGISVLAFDIAAPGTYRFDAAYDDGRQGPQTVLAVGTGFVGGLLVTIALALGVCFAGIAAALAIFLVVLLKRRRGLSMAMR